MPVPRGSRAYAAACRQPRKINVYRPLRCMARHSNFDSHVLIENGNRVKTRAPSAFALDRLSDAAQPYTHKKERCPGRGGCEAESGFKASAQGESPSRSTPHRCIAFAP